MRRRPYLAAGVTVAALAGVGALVWPGRPGLWLAGAALAELGVAAVAALARATAARADEVSPFASLVDPAPLPARPPDLARLERILGWQVYSAPEFRHRVAPALTRILRARLLSRHGVDPAADPGAARALVDPALWPLLEARPDEEEPSRDTPSIERLVDLIEAV